MVAIEKASEMFNSLGLEKFQAEGLLRLYSEYLDNKKGGIGTDLYSRSAPSAERCIPTS